MRKVVLSVLALFVFTVCFGAKKEIGIQLYSVRTVMNAGNYAETHEAVFKALAEMGYTAVEPASYSEGLFYGVTPEQFRSDVEKAGMKVISSHTSHRLSGEEVASGDFSKSLEWWKKAIPAHKATGMEYIVVPSGPKTFNNLKELQVYCDYYNAIGKLCAEQGIKFGYHSHSFEFEKVEGKVMYDYMIEHTDPQYVFFEMDVYWAVYGQVSPVNYFKKYPGRFTLLHIKDWREVGQSGMVGFDAIFDNFDVAGCKGYVVEMEKSSYDDILRTCRESADYLKAAKFVKASYR